MNNTHIVRESMVFYRSFYESVQTLPADVFKKCVCDILNYGLNGEEPKSDGMERAIFTLVKAQIDKNNQRWLNSKKNHGSVTKKQSETPENEEPEQNFEASETVSKPETEPVLQQQKQPQVSTKNENVFYPVPDEVLFSDIPPEMKDFNPYENGSLDEDYFGHSLPVNEIKEAVGEYNNVFLSVNEKDKLIKILGLETYLESVEHLSKYIKRKPQYSSACHYEDLRGWVQDAINKQKKSQVPKKDNPYFDLDFEDLYEKP